MCVGEGWSEAEHMTGLATTVVMGICHLRRA